MKKRTCVTCGKSKPMSLFAVADGFSQQCGYCRTYPPVPRACKACGKYKSAKDFKTKTAETCQECLKQLQEERRIAADKKRRESPAYVLWGYARSRAKQLGIPFTITVDDILIPARCPIRQVKLTVPTGRVTADTMSLDRVKPDLGYVPGNVRVLSMRANQLKNDLDAATAQRVVDYINKEST